MITKVSTNFLIRETTVPDSQISKIPNVKIYYMGATRVNVDPAKSNALSKEVERFFDGPQLGKLGTFRPSDLMDVFGISREDACRLMAIALSTGLIKMSQYNTELLAYRESYARWARSEGLLVSAPYGGL